MFFATLSGLAIAGLIALGATLVAGGSAMAYGSYKTKEEAKAAAIQNKKIYEQNIEALKKTQDDFINMKKDLNNALDYLNSSKKNFADGGHVLDGVPLGSDEFSKLSADLSSAINYAQSFINDISNDISVNKSAIAECDSIING